MDLVGYKLLDENDQVVADWGGTWGQLPGLPEPLILPNGDRVHCPELNVRLAGGFMLVPWEIEHEPSPSDRGLTKRQLRLGLLNNGILVSTVRASIEGAITDPIAREKALTWFDFTDVVQWDHPETQLMLTIAGFTPEAAAAMWMAAWEIEA